MCAQPKLLKLAQSKSDFQDWPPRSHSGDRVDLGDPSREVFGLDKQSEALDFRIRGESWSEDKRLGLLIECALPGLDGQTSHDVLAPQSTARLARVNPLLSQPNISKRL